MITKHFKVKGLHCSDEVSALKKVLTPINGVKDIECELLNEKLTVSFDEKFVKESDIIKAAKKAGLKAFSWENRLKEEQESFWGKYKELLFTALSFIFIICGLLYYLGHHHNLGGVFGAHVTSTDDIPIGSIIFYDLAILFGGWFVLPKAILSVRRLQADMNVLMIIAIIGAMAINQWFEGATVAFLFSLALLLEKWTLGKARRAISKLMDLSPLKARIISNQQTNEVNVEEVEIGETILVKPGEKIPLDGEVLEGFSNVNQAPITGESIPVTKKQKDPVYAGTINGDGALHCTVTKKASDSTLTKIINLVQQAQKKRAKSEQWVQKFSKVYTPCMVLLALLTILLPPLLISAPWEVWIYRGLVILVIACPCALVISTPVTIVSGLTACAKNGILIKGGIFFEALSYLKVIAFDKTGTLTYGKPVVHDVVPLNQHTEEELLQRAASLEQASGHPLAKAIMKKAKENNIEIKEVKNFQVIQGKGAKGILFGKDYWLGSHRFMHEMVSEPKEICKKAIYLEEAGKSVVVIGNINHVCGLLSIADSPRENIENILLQIKSEGIEQNIMLTGDNKPSAKALAEKIKIDAFHAELMPEEKVRYVQGLVNRYSHVAMIGDGVNDAPAMATATCSIAMGAIGTDAAIETADIALMSDDLSKLPWLIRKSKKALKVIKQNIIFSLSLKILFIILALFGDASLWMAIAADTGAALIVIFNGLRLLRK